MALCLITYKPDEKREYLKFLNTFEHFDIYVIIDDNSTNYEDIKKQFTKINFIQIGDSIITTNQRQNAAFRKMLRDMGYKVIMINIRDLWKEGGSIRCLTQCLI